jgi:hypothetical protein
MHHGTTTPLYLKSLTMVMSMSLQECSTGNQLCTAQPPIPTLVHPIESQPSIVWPLVENAQLFGPMIHPTVVGQYTGAHGMHVHSYPNNLGSWDNHLIGTKPWKKQPVC